MRRGYKRRQLIVDRAFQVTFITRFCMSVILTSCLVGALILLMTRNSTTVVIEGSQTIMKPTSEFLFPIIMTTVVWVAIASAIVVMILSLMISHRIAGPALRLRREADLLKAGDLTRDFRIREKDKLQCLSKSLNGMADSLRRHHVQLRNEFEALTYYLQEKKYTITARNKKELSKMLSEIDATLNKYKV